MKYLYRGVSEAMYSTLGGKLTPKKNKAEFSSNVSFGAPHAAFGSGVVFGNSNQNTVVLHQWEQKGFPTSGLSFTPHIDRAKFYATKGGEYASGYLFKVDMQKAINLGVQVFSVNELVPCPSIPEDNEHILVANDYGEIPSGCIVEIIKL